MYIPRFYQNDCLRSLKRVRGQGIDKALFVMASGLGKTLTAAWDAAEFRKTQPKARVLFLCHRNEILVQAKAKFELVNGSVATYGFFHGTEKTAHAVDFLFANFKTMRKHMKRFRKDEFDYVAVDESHHTSAETFLDVVLHWQPKFLLGMTATPDRTDGQDIRRVFGGEIFYLPLEEGFSQGLLTPVDYRLLTDEIKLKQVFEKSERRVSLSMLNRTAFVPKRDEEIVRIIERHAAEMDDPRILIFCQSVRYCDHLAKIMKGAMPLHSYIPPEERIVRGELFRQGAVSTLLTVDVYNEGIDIPEANVLVFLRSTKSHVVFFQQLGRGLRLCDGKDKVIVLDFVGSCERVQTVYSLWEKIQSRRTEVLATTPSLTLKSRRSVPGNVDPFYLNVNAVAFQEKIVKVLDVIRRVSDGYTQDECITALQEFAKKLGRSPTQAEVHKNTEMPSLAAYARHFKSFTGSLQAAGLAVNMLREVTDEDLLQQLRNLHESLGRNPTQKDIAEARKKGLCSCDPVFRDHFGSLTAALTKIGLKPSRYVGLTDEELLDQVRALKKKLGRVPTAMDLLKAAANDETASATAFFDRIGSWNQVLKRLGYPLNRQHHEYSDAELIKELRKAKKILGKVPTGGDLTRLKQQGRIRPSLTAYYGHFKTFDAALKAAGLK